MKFSHYLKLIAYGLSCAAFFDTHVRGSALSDAWLIPVNETVYVGDSMTVTAIGVHACEKRNSKPCIASFDVLPLHSARVNGVLNGNDEVGTIHVGERDFYKAPNQVPSVNPVAISTMLESKDAKNTTLVTHVNIIEKPPTWSGHIRWSFFGHKTEGDALNDLTLHFDQVDSVSAVMAWENKRQKDEQRDDAWVWLNAAYSVKDVLTESLDDEGGGLVVLTMNAPSAVMLGQSVRTETCGGSDTSYTVGETETDAYAQGYISTQLEFSRNGDSSITFVPEPNLKATTLLKYVPCDGETADEVTKDQAVMLSIENPDYQFHQDVTITAMAAPKSFEGSNKEVLTLTVNGIRYRGVAHLHWYLSR